MLGPDGASDTGQRDVDRTARERTCGRQFALKVFSLGDYIFDVDLDLVYSLPHGSLRISRRRLKPFVVQLGEHAALARHPAVPESLELRFVGDRPRFFA